MSTRPQIIRTGPKKEVRTLFVSDRDDADTTNRNMSLHQAGEKETIMGYEIDVWVWGDNNLTNDIYYGGILYIANTDEFLGVPVGVTSTGDQTPQTVFQTQLAADHLTMTHVKFKSKGKRKIGKGQRIYWSSLASGISSAAHILMSGKIYIGE